MLTIENITEDYLSQALGSLVDTFHAEAIGLDEGNMAELYRLTFSGKALPPSVILKLPTRDPVTLKVATRFNSYERESHFYRALSAQTVIRTPACYYNAPDEFVLLLEDLGGWPVPDTATGLDLNEAITAVTDLAKLHASFWSSAPAGVANFQSGFIAAAEDMLAFGLDRLNELTDSTAVNFMRLYAQHSMNHLHIYAEQPQVFSHMDYRLDNMRIDGPDLVLFDWGECSLAPPGFDLAYFLITSLTTSDRRSWELELINIYHLTLKEQGVDYNQDSLFDSYRLAIPPGFYLAALVLTSGHTDDGMILARRCLEAIEDHLPFLKKKF